MRKYMDFLKIPYPKKLPIKHHSIKACASVTKKSSEKIVCLCVYVR